MNKSPMKARLFLIPALAACFAASAQNPFVQPYPTERIGGDVSCYEEMTYSLVFIRLHYGSDSDAPETVQTLRRARSVTCHKFDESGRETEMTEYAQRDAGMGTLSTDGSVTEASVIRRDNPVRTVCYIYDDGQQAGMTVTHDGTTDTVRFEVTDRHGSYTMHMKDGKQCTCRFDSDGYLVRYTDSDGMVTRYSYNENGHLVRTVTEWSDENGESSATFTYDSYEYDASGNWTRRIKNSKVTGEPARPAAIEERSYRYVN